MKPLQEKPDEVIDKRKLIIQLWSVTMIVVVFGISAVTETPAPLVVYGSLAGIGIGARPETLTDIFRSK